LATIVKMDQSGSGKKIANRLVALSSAAVITVYAAGYVRTQSSEARMAERVTRARPATPAEQPVVAALSTPAAPAPEAKKPEDAKKPQAAPQPRTVVDAAPSAVPAAVEAPATTPVAADPDPAPEPAPAAAPVVAPSTPAKPVWRDGTFRGWGTSRHGDIEATVVIEAGRITSAVISQCYTRYPCDYIAHLPAQVVQRQTADVDTVSRATESADAFYFAVTHALAESQKAQ
jgi:uncharacterized protein with FMN-binding domain